MYANRLPQESDGTIMACRTDAVHGIHVHGGRHPGTLAGYDGLGQGHTGSFHSKSDIWVL